VAEVLKGQFRQAVEGFGARVEGVADDQWSAPTPNDEWDVRALVAHVVDEQLWTPPLMAGRTIEEVGDSIPSDPLGDDPLGAWRQASEAGLAAVDEVDLGTTVHLSFGDVPAEEYLSQLFADHLIHAWDLARATGQDERLDPALVEACAAWFAEREELYRQGGVIADRVEVEGDAQARLLGRFGRDPR
jgi:uncharacterized protein (TIGR03086 family)